MIMAFLLTFSIVLNIAMVFLIRYQRTGLLIAAAERLEYRQIALDAMDLNDEILKGSE